MKKLTQSRYAALFSFLLFYILLSSATRILLSVLSYNSVSESKLQIVKSWFIGLPFDLAVATSFVGIYSVYLLFFPTKYIGKLLDRIFTYFFLSVLFLTSLFSSFAEFPFWDEFKTRFNFIAVDYLIYTYEVVSNINQSYPIPLILVVLLVLIAALFYLLKRKNIFKATFSDTMKFPKRLMLTSIVLATSVCLLGILKNSTAETTENTYINELSKNGVFSFFAALRSNELDYSKFYPTLEDKQAYAILKKNLVEKGEHYSNSNYDNITRQISGNSNKTPNIILICIESFSAEFLNSFGNSQNLTPNYDALAKESIFFKNMFATGTRTVRGMEALTLSVPPTPGNSIVRRPNNEQLFSIATILKNKHYDLSFIYGGDGYFDNMNSFFGGQGFTIIDRNRGNPLPEKIHTERIAIEDKDVTFENAWGICDEDIYKQALKRGDVMAKNNKPFFQFVMTTSNHKPYSFPKGKITDNEGSREAAVKYTDFALGQFIASARKKPWFKNTIFVVVADHCASSAGKWEINTEKHHIPAIIYNLPQHKNIQVEKLVSQIDLMPTLFSLLDWNYNSALYGKDIFKMTPSDERALLGNYRTLGLLKNGIFTQINDHKETKQFVFDPKTKSIQKDQLQIIDSLKKSTIAYYQTASERFSNGKMKEVKN